MRDLKQYGGWALVTGPAQGLGRAFAKAIAAQGVNCVLAGIESERLEELAHELTSQDGIQCRVITQDLTHNDFLDHVTSQTADIPVSLLVNNAGIASGGRFHELKRDGVDKLVHLNCLAPALLTHAYLPDMVERRRGGIIFVASIMGLLAAPGETAYCASKAFDLHFGESLWGELRGTGVDVLTLVPAGMQTGFFAADGIHPDDVARLHRLSAPPERLANLALRNLGRKPTVMPWDAWWMTFPVRFAPRWLTPLVVNSIMRRLVRYVDTNGESV